MRGDPVVRAMKAVCAVAVVIIVVMIVAGIRRDQAQAAINCPPQDHPVWAQVLNHGHGEWICGSSLTVGVKARP